MEKAMLQVLLLEVLKVMRHERRQPKFCFPSCESVLEFCRRADPSVYHSGS